MRLGIKGRLGLNRSTRLCGNGKLPKTRYHNQQQSISIREGRKWSRSVVTCLWVHFCLSVRKHTHEILFYPFIYSTIPLAFILIILQQPKPSGHQELVGKKAFTELKNKMAESNEKMCESKKIVMMVTTLLILISVWIIILFDVTKIQLLVVFLCSCLSQIAGAKKLFRPKWKCRNRIWGERDPQEAPARRRLANGAIHE